ncbi:AzlD domain-containing protein [Enterovirga aerilata]|uniref:AzlD domain-containing protein n=1 Tax=Enterovirga aerilata TaxID=2730920 RepID=A0A849I9K5_9HYPH|nr:AzlD domain-containing protein [Enterovirga sp. DB1703]NNM73991.1 AzlD domain-containing protein [Enterovirga sp. DB1703]
MSEALWPYLVILLAGVLPNEIFRVAAVFLSRGIDEESELFRWIRVVATTLLAAVVCRLIYSPAAALEQVPLAIRASALPVGIAAFFLLRRSLVLGILAGEAWFVLAAWWFGRA